MCVCVHSLAMFYVIALAGAHKRVINQLRDQLAMVKHSLTHTKHTYSQIISQVNFICIARLTNGHCLKAFLQRNTNIYTFAK